MDLTKEIPGDEIRKPTDHLSSKQVQFNSSLGSLGEKKTKNLSELGDGKTPNIQSSHLSNSNNASPDDKRKK